MTPNMIEHCRNAILQETDSLLTAERRSNSASVLQVRATS
jgi:hypothetical protein